MLNEMFNSGSNFGENYSDAISFFEGNAVSMEPVSYFLKSVKLPDPEMGMNSSLLFMD